MGTAAVFEIVYHKPRPTVGYTKMIVVRCLLSLPGSNLGKSWLSKSSFDVPSHSSNITSPAIILTDHRRNQRLFDGQLYTKHRDAFSKS